MYDLIFKCLYIVAKQIGGKYKTTGRSPAERCCDSAERCPTSDYSPAADQSTEGEGG